MEIKTCEQYVLDELNRTKEALAKVQDELASANARINELTSEHREIVKVCDECISVKGSDDERYLDIDVWEKYDKDKFEYLVAALGLTDDRK